MGQLINLPILTLIQPWASWIAYGLKTIETRTHARFSSLVGKTIGIHAGLKYDYSAVQCAHEADNIDGPFTTQLRERVLSIPDYPQGAIIAIAKVREFRELKAADSRAACINCKNYHRYGLILTDVRKITPIPAKGKQGVWYHEVEI